jgi:microcin C transport system substrate-binding protein
MRVSYAVLHLFAAAALLLAGSAGAGAEGVWRGHGISMYGDLRYGADFKHFDYVNPKAPRGGELRLTPPEGGTFDSFNPFIIKGNPAAGVSSGLDQSYIYDSLMTHSADEPFSMYGLLAETVEVPDDRSWVAFTLREKARFADGRPVTVEDVIWTFETLVSQGAPLYRFYFGNVAKVEKAGPRKVLFTFQPGDNRELPLILGQLPVLPRHAFADRPFDESSLELPLGSGPYRVGKFEAGRFVTYERRDDYWGRDLPVNVGRWNFDRIHLQYYRDADVAVEAFKGGEYDFRAENNSKIWATQYDMPEIEKGLVVKEELPQERVAGMQGFAFNLRREMFQDRRVRYALAHAFDFEWSNKALFYGQYTRTRSYFDNSELAATGLPGPEELALLEPYRGRIPDEVFTVEYQPPSTAGPGGLRANLKRAVELLGEAGWKVKDGVMTHTESGRPLAFEILLVQPAFERIVLPFAKNLERLGVQARVRTVDASQYRRRMDQFDFDMTVATFGQSSSPGNEQRDYWSSEAAAREGSRNVIGIRNPVVDELVESLIASPSRKDLVMRVRALDRVLQWGHYVVPNWHIVADRVIYWRKLHRPATTPPQGVQLDTWWIQP